MGRKTRRRSRKRRSRKRSGAGSHKVRARVAKSQVALLRAGSSVAKKLRRSLTPAALIAQKKKLKSIRKGVGKLERALGKAVRTAVKGRRSKRRRSKRKRSKRKRSRKRSRRRRSKRRGSRKRRRSRRRRRR